MRGLLVAFSVAAVCLLLGVSCGGGSTTPSLQADIASPAIEQAYTADQVIPTVGELPRAAMAVGEYLQLDSPVSTGDLYTEGNITATAIGEMAWATFQVSGYSEQYPPNVLRIYGNSASCETFWVGFADFDKEAWVWTPATRDLSTDYPYDGQNLIEVPDEGQFFRESDGIAFVTILLVRENEEDTDFVKFSSARLAARRGEFYESEFFIDSEEDAERLRGYSMMHGDLILECGSFSLDGLSDLLYIDNLVMFSPAEQDFKSLENLQVVKSSLYIDNKTSTGVCEFASLFDVGALEVINDGYASIRFPQLFTAESIIVGSYIVVDELGFPALESVEDRFWLYGPNTTSDSEQDIQLNALKTAGTINISNMHATELNLWGLSRIEEITIGDMPHLERIKTGSISVRDISLYNLPEFTGLTSGRFKPQELDGDLPTLELRELPSLMSASSFNNSSWSYDEFYSIEIVDCESLTSLSGLNWVDKVQNLCLLNLESLTSASALDGLELKSTYDDDESGEYIFRNTGIDRLPEFEVPADFTCRSFIIRENPNLASISGLTGLTKLRDGLIVRDNASLTSLTGLDDLVYGGWKIRITENDSLENLNPLNSLRYLTTDDPLNKTCVLEIVLNPALTDISGLSGLLPDPVSGYVVYGGVDIASNGLTNGDQDAWDVVNAWGGEATVSDIVRIFDNG